ncbi:unnamed protein product [Adineta steineri]|uniref:F-box domain-containing protein n=1 Tax=Adineta steineri TaxID=433720 RepID=A0A816EP76_9BILA|nr:unnamed protein product [Adineta steineri]CAF1648576.1 unnamed protein product [Adineta steineri]
MNDILVQLDDLPDEILLYIFKKLYNDEVIYSLMGINQRLNRIAKDTTSTRRLCLFEYCIVDDFAFPLSDSILDRFCSKFLPEIGHQIESLFLERTSIERVLRATNYPYLNYLGLCNINYKLALSLFDELHVCVSNMDECLYMLDGRIDQLCVLYIIFKSIKFRSSNIEHTQKLLPNLRIFSLSCDEKILEFDKSIMPLLHRMINLEELHLNIIVKCNDKYFDGDILKKNILIYMPRLHKFTFSIYSIINHNDQINLPLTKKYIRETFKDLFFNNQIISCIDHFQEEGFIQCHIYTYPYKSYFYSNITNDFQDGLFLCVTKVSLFDERPFEYEFFP